MPDALTEAFSAARAVEGLWWLVITSFIAGIVRGFSGFGTAMIYLPIAAKFMDPIWALISLTLMDIFGPIPNLPRALRDGRMQDVALLALATLLCLPLGLALLFALPEEVFRYGVSALALAVPLLLMAGLRYRGAMSRPLLAGVGGVAGITGGAAGLPGPPVVLLYASSTRPVSEIRGNILTYLFSFDLILMGWLAYGGRLELAPMLLGLVLFLPVAAGNMLGAAIFDPAKESLYRGVAYMAVMSSAVMSLPIWE